MPELMSINRAISFHKPLNLFEIGTFNGRTTLNMAANCSKKSRVYTLDLPRSNINSTKLHLDPSDKLFIDKEIIGLNYLRTAYKKKIIQLYGDSATFDFSHFNNKMDFVFIDGSHSYEYLLNDSKKALSLLRDGKGIIMWHDYGSWIGVTKALNELYSKDENFKNLKHIQGTSLAYLFIDSKLK
jgi:predicted O-methyltransferase YrrM